MENKTQKTLTFVGAIVIALLLIGIVITTVSNSKGKRNLNAEKLTSEKLLSEKLSAEKELAKLNTDFSALKQKNDANQKLLAEVNLKITENDKKINLLKNENRSLQANKKELEELRKVKSDLEKESSRLKSDYDRLTAQNKDLQNSMSSLEAEKKNLLLQLENAGKVNTDNFLATAKRGKKTEKLVSSCSYLFFSTIRSWNLRVTINSANIIPLSLIV